MAQFPTFQAGGDPNHVFRGVSVTGLFRPPNHITGRSYPILFSGTIGNIALGAVDTIYLTPFFMPDTMNFTGGKARVITGGAGSSIKTGIWANSTVSNRPVGAPLIADNTGVATTATATVNLAWGTGTLQSGFYWFGMKTTGTPPAMQTCVTGVAGMMGNSDPAFLSITFADAYANALPTFAEGATFSDNGNGFNFQAAFVSA